MARPVVFLDACVLYPPLVRGILLGGAKAGLFAPHWSPRVLEEWRIAVARNEGVEAEDSMAAAHREMAKRFPDASVVAAPDLEETLTLPDAADTHVLAAAIAAKADVLLTFNLSDFPKRRLAAHRVVPRHPDGYLWELFSAEPEMMAEAIREAAGAQEAEAIRRGLKRAKLPRLAKAWRAHAGSSPRTRGN